MNVASLPVKGRGIVRAIHAPESQAALVQQLGDLGFLQGEAVTVLRHGWLGGDPILVRVGGATYALRRAEAQCIEVEQAA
jgi:ferrous iron transport protein A